MEATVTQQDEVYLSNLKQKINSNLPESIERKIRLHNDILNKINQFEENLDQLTPFQIAKLEHLYNLAEREAWKIAGYYKSLYQFYNGRASTQRGQSYIYMRTDENQKRNINDANYASRIEGCRNLEIAGIYEGYFVSWRGIAQSYQGMQNTCKDMIKALEKEI